VTIPIRLILYILYFAPSSPHRNQKFVLNCGLVFHCLDMPLFIILQLVDFGAISNLGLLWLKMLRALLYKPLFWWTLAYISLESVPGSRISRS
jgi:hypothetical protein